MDVVPDRGLLDFIESLQEKKVDISQVVDKEKETDVWSGIADALNNWSQHMLDAESRYSRFR